MFKIVATGPGATDRRESVINPHTNEVLTFATRKAARAHAAEILPAMPSKYLPMRVVTA